MGRGYKTLCSCPSGILLDAILSNFSRAQSLGLPLKMVMYSAVSPWEGQGLAATWVAVVVKTMSSKPTAWGHPYLLQYLWETQ